MTAHDPKLANDVRVGQAILKRILEAGVDPRDPDLPDLFDAETDVLDRLRQMVRAARESEAHADAIGEVMREMRERRDRIEARAEKLREAVSWALQELGMKKLEAPDFCGSLVVGKPPLVGLDGVDPNRLPEECCKRTVSRTAVRAWLESGRSLDGVSLGNPVPVFRISTR
jgi:hypothetical protein